MSDINKFSIIETYLVSLTNKNLPPILLNNVNSIKARDPDTSKPAIVSMIIEESMYSSTIYGEATIRDFESGYNDFLPGLSPDDAKNGLIGLGGYDLLKIKMVKSGGAGPDENITFYLLIYAYSQESNETLSLYNTNPRTLKLKLASPEFVLMNYAFFDYFENDEDMILPISKIKEQTGEESENFVGPPSELAPEQSGKPYSGEGLVQYLVNTLQDRMKQYISDPDYIRPGFTAEETKNWMWLKRNVDFYPWSKRSSPPLVGQLIQTLTEQAVSTKWDYGKKAANFFFWRTLDSWNFRSLESLVKQPPWKTYYLSAGLDEEESIRALSSEEIEEAIFDSYNETDYLNLLESSAFGSYYVLNEPRYQEDPYARYLDADAGHIERVIKYDYILDGNSWSKLPQTEIKHAQIIGGSINATGGILNELWKNKQTLRNYGYFSPGFYNKKENVPWEYHGYKYSTRKEETLWQTQYDITDLDGQKLYWIEKEIKQKLKKKKEEYAKKKNLKEKWKVYRCSICCAGAAGEASPIGGASGANDPSELFTDSRFLKSFNLKDTDVSTYEVVAAGSFTDVLNYDSANVGVGFTGSTMNDDNGDPIIEEFQNEWTRSGMTMSYNLNESPYNLSLGEFFSLEKKPDNFVKYRFDLEIKRHEKLREILESNIQARKTRIKDYNDQVTGYTLAYLNRNTVCVDAGCTGNCLCPTEYPETVMAKAALVSTAHDALSEHEDRILKLIGPNIDKLKALKQEFIDLYDKYWSRKAFFFSRNIDFSFLKSQNNLLNVKSITRKPIRGSKYEPFAVRKAFSGYTFSNGYSAYYPYDVPPYWNDLGETESGQSIINAGFQNNIQGITVDVYFGRKYDNFEQEFDDGTKSKAVAADFWSSFEAPFSSFPYAESNEEKAKGPIWYRNWIVNYDISLIKPPCLNRKPPCFDGDCSCDEILLPLNMHFETFANGETADILMGITQISDYAFTQLSKNCDGCKIRITSVLPSSDVKLYHPWAADELNPSGFSFDEYANYKKAASLFKDKPGITGFYDNEDNELNDAFDRWTPPHLALEGLESYVRIEFKTPIGTDSIKNFPEGFIDTHGSEYFMPYIVLATAGPFGSQSARANISVIGQDPYGFDLAVKKTKNKDDFAGMNLMYTNDVYGDVGDPNQEYADYTGQIKKYSYPDLRFPFATSSSWMKTSQNSLFYKPKDGIADLFVPNGIQDIFKASTLEKSFPAKTWWDMWVSLPPVAVSTFYNRWDVVGASGGSLKKDSQEVQKWYGNLEALNGVTYQGIGFYHNNSIVAKPVTWTGAVGPSGCSGGCEEDPPWPLFLQPDTEQIISGAFPYNVAVQTADDLLDSFGNLGNFYYTSDPGNTAKNAASILPSDPSNYIYNFAEFPHIVGTKGIGGMTGIQRGLNYPVISYPVGTLIWGKNIDQVSELEGILGENVTLYDYNFVHRYDISRKTQYGIVQLSADSMPSMITLVGGVGGSIQKVEQYNKWISDRLIEWFQNTIFDNNFSGQFVVLSKEGSSCKGYPCMNPDGFPGIDGCPAGDPLCNCPCQGPTANKGQKMSSYLGGGFTAPMPDEMVLRPDLMDIVFDRFIGITMAAIGSYGPEPSSIELRLLEAQINECELIKSHPQLGESYLGCVWDDPNSTYNCTCPCIGKNFPEYMKYNRTNASFWGTPPEAPLYRNAQMALFNSNKIKMRVPGNLSLLTGDVVDIKAQVSDKPKRFSGRWLVTTIKHVFNPDFHMMEVVLSRELPHPNTVSSSTEPQTQQTDQV